ncbi:MAG: helix-hairpin-helix domain-containing protein, partial [Candidatus Thiodiazotropha endolucinida]|nr:helix-hairpin-helix domain-containing protein [Candidatus Thiodiazotropha taylori]MCW4341868.1 helix-hairpin-helix domain-containing protein [Candidatus Thiodiazotropha endolucinida]
MLQDLPELPSVPIITGLSSVPKIKVNFADAHELQLIPGVGVKLAKVLIDLREAQGNVDASLLANLLRRKLEPEVLAFLDFVPNPTYGEGEDEYMNYGEGAVGGKLDSDTELVKTQIKKEIERSLWPGGTGRGYTQPSKTERYDDVGAFPVSLPVPTRPKIAPKKAADLKLEDNSSGEKSVDWHRAKEMKDGLRRKLRLSDISSAEEKPRLSRGKSRRNRDKSSQSEDSSSADDESPMRISKKVKGKKGDNCTEEPVERKKKSSKA